MEIIAIYTRKKSASSIEVQPNQFGPTLSLPMTNVTSIRTPEAGELINPMWGIPQELLEFLHFVEEYRVVYANAPITIGVGNAVDLFWWRINAPEGSVIDNRDVELAFNILFETYTETLVGDITITQNGTFMVLAVLPATGDAVQFNIVVGGETPAQAAPVAPAPTPAPAPVVPVPTPAPAPTPVPAPVVIAPVAAAGLVTTDRLVTVIPPAPVAGQPLLYTVQAGETLWTIAFNYYGSMQSEVVNRIFAANRDVIPANGALTAGMVITLPAQGLRQPVMQAHLDNAAGVYLVRQGDTLADIAYHFFGDRTQWRRIREANSPRVGTNNMIFEGQWLIIPQ